VPRPVVLPGRVPRVSRWMALAVRFEKPDPTGTRPDPATRPATDRHRPRLAKATADVGKTIQNLGWL